MTSTRRSSRGVTKNNNKKYKEFDSDDEDGKLALFEESGSDFEEDIKKQKFNGKTQILAVESSSSEEEMESVHESEDEIEEEIEVPRKKDKKKPVKNSAAVLMKQRENWLEKANLKKQIVTQKSPYFAMSSSTTNLAKSLSLSESSSSEDESSTPPKASESKPKLTKLSSSKKSKSKPNTTVLEPKKESESEEEIDFSSQLVALAQSQVLVKNEDPKKPSPKKTPQKSSLLGADSSNIAKLLAMGEGVSLSESEEETEEVKEEIKEETKNNVISIELPDANGFNRKRKKKGFDMEAYVKRELARAQRELQMLKHQTHVVCLLAHLRFLNSLAAFPPYDHDSAETLLGIAMSIIPSAHNVSPKDLTPVRLASFVSWFKSAFQCLNEDPTKFPHPIDDWLMRAMENYICTSSVQRVLLFLLAARSMGWPTRLVFNMDPVSHKPEKSLNGKLCEILGKEFEEMKKDEAGPSSKSPKKEAEPVKLKNEKSPEKSSKHKKSDTKSPERSQKKSPEKKSSRSRSKKETETSSKDSKKEASNPKSSRSKKETETSSKDSKKEASNSRSSRSKKELKTDESGKKSTSSRSKSSKSGSEKSTSSRSKSSKIEPEKSTSSRSKSSKSQEREPSKSASLSESVKSAIEKRKVAKKSDFGPRTNSDSEDEKPKKPSRKRKSDPIKEPPEKKKSAKRATKSEYFPKKDSDSDSEKDFEPQKKKSSKKTVSETSKKIAKIKTEKAKGLPYWCEVYVRNSGWITVDIDQGRVNCASEMEERCGIKPLLYIVAINADSTFKDVTRRYAGERFDTQVRKSRSMTDAWFSDTLQPFLRKERKSIDDEEDKQLEKLATSAPMPTSIGAFKNHPLYALSRHLLKFEAIYPPDAPPLGYIRSEPIYARECVHSLQGRTNWLKEGRIVKIGQEPYKVVKARPKWDRMSGTMAKDKPLEVFGRWQTETYIPPPAKDGKVPRNEYGNVELFKPWMLPKGTVHVPITGKGL